MNIVFNIWIAPCLLNEKPKAKDIIATFIIVAGCVLSVTSGQHEQCIFSVEELYSLYGTLRMKVYGFSIPCTTYIDRLLLVILELFSLPW
jgi:hypothetical protein